MQARAGTLICMSVCGCLWVCCCAPNIAAGGAIISNTRFDPNKESLENKVKHSKRKDRGSVGVPGLRGMNDWEKTNAFATQVLIQRDLVLHFEEMPGQDGILVLSPPWAGKVMRDWGWRLLGTDCKADTTRGKSKFSVIRCPTPKGWIACVVAVSEGEDHVTIRKLLAAAARNVPCKDPGCPHQSVSKWVQLVNGKKLYLRGLACRYCTFFAHLHTSLTCTVLQHAAGLAHPHLFVELP